MSGFLLFLSQYMNSSFQTFRTFHEVDSLEYFTALLKANNIDFRVENNSQNFDPSFANNEFNKEFTVKVEPENFERVYQLEEDSIKKEIENASEDYYLFDYTNEELQDIIAKRDEWNAYDYFLAKKILTERGEIITDEIIQQNNTERIAQLKKPENINSVWLIIFYIIAFWGGFFAIFIGYYIMTAKRTLPNGETVKRFSSRDVIHGSRIFYLGIFFLIFWLFKGLLLDPILGLSILYGR